MRLRCDKDYAFESPCAFWRLWSRKTRIGKSGVVTGIARKTPFCPIEVKKRYVSRLVNVCSCTSKGSKSELDHGEASWMDILGKSKRRQRVVVLRKKQVVSPWTQLEWVVRALHRTFVPGGYLVDPHAKPAGLSRGPGRPIRIRLPQSGVDEDERMPCQGRYAWFLQCYCRKCHPAPLHKSSSELIRQEIKDLLRSTLVELDSVSRVSRDHGCPMDTWRAREDVLEIRRALDAKTDMSEPELRRLRTRCVEGERKAKHSLAVAEASTPW